MPGITAGYGQGKNGTVKSFTVIFHGSFFIKKAVTTIIAAMYSRSLNVFSGTWRQKVLFPGIHFMRNSMFVKKTYASFLCSPGSFPFLSVMQGLQFHGNMRRTKDAFVFGCATALRFSDLMNLRVRNLEKIGADYFLDYLSIKTATPVKVKLPAFAADIFARYARKKRISARVFPHSSLFGFNKRLKKIGELAGWTMPLGKFRSRNGVSAEQKANHRVYRFCDMLSSHVMRKTGITFLLMLGMPEYLVRKISGHAAHSPSFFRYVNFAQSYITDEITRVHDKLLSQYILPGTERSDDKQVTV
jgi:hypothetical protein